MLIDTNVWSELIRPRPNDAVVALLAEKRDTLFLSTIVIAEMEFGVAKEGNPARAATLRRFVDDIVLRYQDRVLEPDLATARVFGVIKARLRATGKPIADMDMLIAAQAVAADMPLATRNVSDMARTGATIVNPWAT